jgi:hypothetical protein
MLSHPVYYRLQVKEPSLGLSGPSAVQENVSRGNFIAAMSLTSEDLRDLHGHLKTQVREKELNAEFCHGIVMICVGPMF